MSLKQHLPSEMANFMPLDIDDIIAIRFAVIFKKSPIPCKCLGSFIQDAKLSLENVCIIESVMHWYLVALWRNF